MLFPPPMIGRLPAPGRFRADDRSVSQCPAGRRCPGRSPMPGRLPMLGPVADAGSVADPRCARPFANARSFTTGRGTRCRGESRHPAARPRDGSHFPGWAGSPVRTAHGLCAMAGRVTGLPGRRGRIGYSHRRSGRGRWRRASARPAHLRKRRPRGRAAGREAAAGGRDTLPAAGRDALGPIEGRGAAVPPPPPHVRHHRRHRRRGRPTSEWSRQDQTCDQEGRQPRSVLVCHQCSPSRCGFPGPGPIHFAGAGGLRTIFTSKSGSAVLPRIRSKPFMR